MKTLQTILTAIILSLTSASFASGGDDPKNVNSNSFLTLVIVNIQSPTCNGGENGSATVIAKGGKAPYTYNWNTFPNQSSAIATNLTSGTYFVQVTDANGAVFFKPVYVEEPNVSVLTTDESVSDALDLTASVSGINAPYSYELNGEPVNSQDMSNLTTGLYKLVITDANECEMTQYIQVFEVQSEPNGTPQDGTTPKNEKEDKEQMKSKNDRHVEASNLIPTNITDRQEILVTVSSH